MLGVVDLSGSMCHLFEEASVVLKIFFQQSLQGGRQWQKHFVLERHLYWFSSTFQIVEDEDIKIVTI